MKDIEIIKINIKEEEELALGLYKIYTHHKNKLSEKNKLNLSLNKMIVKLKCVVAD